MDKKRYILIGACAVIIVFSSVLLYGSSTAFKTSGTPKVTYFDFGDVSLPVKAYRGTYEYLEELVEDLDRITVYYTKDNTIAKYLETVDYTIHAEKLGFFDKFMIFCHRNGTAENPVILVENGDLSISVVRKNVFIIRAQSLDEIQGLFTYASEHVYDFPALPYKIEIPFSLGEENFNLDAFSGIEQDTLKQDQNKIFTIMRTPLIGGTEKLYLFHSPWEGKGKENSALTKGVVYISNIFGRVKGEVIKDILVIADITPLDKLMIYMEIIGTEESPIYYVRTAADNAEKDGIFIPREGFIYLEVVNYEDIEKFCMGLATILGGS
jgi:hypothetical protein